MLAAGLLGGRPRLRFRRRTTDKGLDSLGTIGYLGQRMPLYCYKRPDGEIVEEYRSIANRDDPLDLGNGKFAERYWQAERPYIAVKRNRKERPRGSREDLGVNPNQVVAMNDLLVRRGCPPCRFDRTGIAYPEDRGHVKKIMRARGLVNVDKKGVGDVDPHGSLAQEVVDNI